MKTEDMARKMDLGAVLAELAQLLPDRFRTFQGAYSQFWQAWIEGEWRYVASHPQTEDLRLPHPDWTEVMLGLEEEFRARDWNYTVSSFVLPGHPRWYQVQLSDGTHDGHWEASGDSLRLALVLALLAALTPPEEITPEEFIRREAPNWAGVGDAVAWVRQLRGDLPDEKHAEALLPVPEASGGAGEVLGNDTPERLPYQCDLTGQDGEVYATIEVEADPAGHPLPLGLTLHRAVLLEAHAGGDEADVVLPLTLGEAQALGERLVEGARAGRSGCKTIPHGRTTVDGR